MGKSTPMQMRAASAKLPAADNSAREGTVVRLRDDVTSGGLEPFWQVVDGEPGVGMELAVIGETERFPADEWGSIGDGSR